MAQSQRVNTAERKSAYGNRRNRTDVRVREEYTQDTYIYGNTVRKTEIRRQLEEAPRRRLSNETRKNREKAHYMSLGYVLFLFAALCTSAIVLINYIQLQAELTTKLETISALERELNNLRLSNDEEYMRINSSLDLEEIRRIAIGELGMTYAQEGQIDTYSNEGHDYMRQATGE